MSERKPVTVWHVYEKTLSVWADGELVAKIPSTQWQRLIMKLAEQYWENEASDGKTQKADQ
jgi:hypothetical protein